MFDVCAFFRQPMELAHQMLGEGDAVRLDLVTSLIHLAQVSFSVQMDARFVSVVNYPAAEIHLLVAASAASSTNGFPLIPVHSSSPLRSSVLKSYQLAQNATEKKMAGIWVVGQIGKREGRCE
jgi:hypothetical protein